MQAEAYIDLCVILMYNVLSIPFLYISDKR